MLIRNPEIVPEDLRDRYEVYDFRHASAILTVRYEELFEEVCAALRGFYFTEEEIKTPGGSESEITKRFETLLRPNGWDEVQLKARLLVGEEEVSHDTHKVDFVKGKVALDYEWNSKDQTFDRDLFAFRAFFEYGKIDVGIIVTRSNELDPYFRSLGTYTDRTGRVRWYKDKYGASTTHMGKLLSRLRAGRGGGCPLLIFGITPKALPDGPGRDRALALARAREIVVEPEIVTEAAAEELLSDPTQADGDPSDE